MGLTEWLFLWLKSLSKVTMDDVRGGLVTVMGVLETRGVRFEGVVIVDFNEGVVPATSSKDQFLNSQVRAFANLPTKHDREALQKQYYKRLLEQASQSVILYSTSDSKLPSKFLYELGLGEAVQTQAQFDLLYSQESQLVSATPIVVEFDPKSIVWSASRLRVYLECKYKYYYQYTLGIHEKQRDEMNEGQFLHKLLEKLFSQTSSYASKKEMQKNIDMLLDTLYLEKGSKVAYQKLLWKEKLKGFVSSQLEHFDTGWKVLHREKEFQGEIAGLRFKGRIDRIDQNDTDTLVLDYKSGRVEKEPKTLNPDKITDFQMPIYQQLLSGKYQNISLAFLKILDNGEMQEVKHLEERNTLLEEQIAILRNATSFTVEMCDVSKKCRFCEDVLML
ncbi:MAG: Dna2/Cas4 domain-containing protein [Sulfurovum sp.]|nr:Dna2/Cas4 domain-containing protein [Sulfurovum sp.]